MNWKQAQHERDNELPSETIHCNSCEEPITGQYFETKAILLCPTCFERLSGEEKCD